MVKLCCNSLTEDEAAVKNDDLELCLLTWINVHDILLQGKGSWIMMLYDLA